MVGCCRKFYIGPAEVAAFLTRILAKGINMTHSDMLFRMGISTFYFFKPLILQIFVSWKFIKTEASPCLLSLLLSAAIRITIFINIFVSNIIQ